MEPFIGQIIMFAGNFAPRGWALCNGQLLAIASNSALFSVIGTAYGGDGQTTFALPDLRGRLAMGSGAGAGLSPRPLGQKGGEEQVTLTTAQIPAHAHGLSASNQDPTTRDPTGHALAQAQIYTTRAPNDPMSAGSVASAGGGQPHDNMSPFLAVNFIIALEGIYPQRE
ncbi:MAG: phage tail protein [Myxococcales bacterium]|nr:phage tail protein [Myxococcales bacterium]